MCETEKKKNVSRDAEFWTSLLFLSSFQRNAQYFPEADILQAPGNPPK